MAARRGPKRPPPPKVNLPTISEYAVERLANVLRERSQSQRLPDQTARVLVLFVLMWQSSPPIPVPDRKQIAEHLGVSVPCVDVTLSYRQGTGDISIAYQTVRGNIGGRLHSTVRQRFAIPSDEICKIVNNAIAAEATATTVETAKATPSAPRKKNNPSSNNPGNPGNPEGAFVPVAEPALNSSIGCEVPVKKRRSRKKVAA